MSPVATVGTMAFKISKKILSGHNPKYIPVGLRNSIVGFSKSAKRNFLWRLQTLDFKALSKSFNAYFVTLTYQRDFFLRYRDLVLAKRDLHRFFRQELKFFLGNDWFSFWKLEFHRSGVPHFHLFLVVRSNFKYSDVLNAVNNAWIKSACFDASDDVRRVMKLSSTQVLYSPLDLFSVLMVYVSKEVGKEFQISSVLPNPGRFWGIYNRKLYKAFVREVEYDISDWVFYRLRRDVKRWVKSKGYHLKFRSRDGVRAFYIGNVDDFHRLLFFYGVSYEQKKG